MKTFGKHFTSPLCLMQQHFDGTNYSQVAMSLSKMRKEEEDQQQQKRPKTSQGWKRF